MSVTIRSGSKFLFVAVSLLFHFCWLMVCIFILGKNEKRGFRIRKSFCRSAMRILGIQVSFHSAPQPLVCLFISNHRSLLDPLIELGYIDTHILSKADVEKYPLMGPGSRATGVIFVERTDPDSRRAALNKIEKTLLNGASVLIYPEGTTHREKLTSEFKRGTFDVAFHKQIPVVPVMIEYPDSGYYWTDGSLLDYFNTIFSRPGKHQVILQIGPPIFAQSAEELLKSTQSTINSMIASTKVDH